MKTNFFLSLIFFLLVTSVLTAQAPDTYPMNKNAAIQFLNTSNVYDSTEIIRKGGNSLQIRYKGSPLRFWALDDKPLQIRNSLDEVKIQLNPNSGKSYILGKLGINTDIVEGNYKLIVDGNIKASETHVSKIKFLNNADTLDGTEIVKANGNALRLKYFGNNLIFDALDDKPVQIRNAANESMVQFSPNGKSYFMGGYVGFGTTAVQTPLHIKQSDWRGLRFEREGHETYELRLAGSTGFHIWNVTNDVSEMVFNGNGFVGIGTTLPLSLLHLKQIDEKGLRFERDGHDTYELGVAGSQGLYITNKTSGEYEMVFDNGSIGIGTNTPSNNAKLNIVGGTDAAISCPDCGYLVIGNVNSKNVAFDNNEIMARDNGAISNLGLQVDGGSLSIHSSSSIPDYQKVHITDSGNVGIGTVSPAFKLDVVDNSPTFRVKADVNEREIIIKPGDGNIEMADSVSTLHLNRWSPSPVKIAGGGGSVSVGTENAPAGYKFSVDGKIISEELKVRNSGNWPDYVFEKDYPLMSLDKLEEHIQLNGHLPGMPNAAEVKENGGVEVGDMQQRLLEKVEELTLHIIQLEKRIKELEQPAKNE